MQVSVNTVVQISDPVLLDILNVAINGGCEGWATVSEKRQGVDSPHQFVSAKFTSRSDSAFAMHVTMREIGMGIEAALFHGTGGTIPKAIKAQILRVVANDDATEVDLGVANFVVRSVMNRFAYAHAA